MFKILAQEYVSQYGFLNLFNFITFRVGASILTSLFFSLIFGQFIINKLSKIQPHGQPIRNDGPQTHIIQKAGTPTMGGVLIILSVFSSSFLWSDLYNNFIWIGLLTLISFGFIGLIDDYNKIKSNSSNGLKAITRIILQIFFSLIFGQFIISKLSKIQPNGQPIRNDGPQTHIIKKAGTPTMGGVLILGTLFFSSLLWARSDNGYVWIVLLVTVGFGGIGFLDDYLKVTKNNVKGFSSKARILLGLLISLIAAYLAQKLHSDDLSRHLALPIFKDTLLNLGIIYFPFAMIVIVGAANAVNLTDGLDGLAIMPVIIAAGTLGAIAYVVGRTDFTAYLDVHYVEGTGELLVFTSALVGAGLGFLWYNAPPAAVFMGDTGSLALGGALGAIAVATKHELVLAIVGGLFVVEALSVIIQVLYYKRTGKRVFLMAPIHHHFEKKGWGESQIVIRFWIIALILALIGLATLKLR